MAKPEELREEVLEFVEDEGKPRFELAPMKEIPRNAPDTWKTILGDDNPVTSVLKTLWSPKRALLPGTIAQLRKKLRHIGFLQTNEIAMSLIYVFEDEDEPIYYRGLPHKSIERSEAKKLPKEFLEIYEIHDGWTNIFGQMGPMPSDDWFDLGVIYPENYSKILPGVRSKDFLVICDTGGSGYLGFDLSKKPPIGLICSVRDPVEVSPDVVQTLDEWMAEQLEDMT